MVQEPCQGCPVCERHGEGPLGPLHGQTVAHRPADHATRVEIEDDGEVEPALCGPQVREVPGPDPIRRLDRELTIEGVLGHGQSVIRLGGGAPPLHGLGPDAVRAHQPGHAMFTDAMPLIDQSVPDAGTAVGLTGLLVDHSNSREQGAGVRRPGTLRP